MRTVFVACLLAFVAAEDAFVKFNDFIIKYEKRYDNLHEFEYRFKVFQSTLERIAKQNADHVAIGGAEVFGVNTFADMTVEEFSVRLMKNLAPREPQGPETYDFSIPAPATIVDWRNITQLVQLRIKDNADHAGLTLLTRPLNHSISSRTTEVLFMTSVNNNALLALITTMVATEDGLTMLTALPFQVEVESTATLIILTILLWLETANSVPQVKPISP